MRYDYIFTGVGMAALMVLKEMKLANLLSGKPILLLEPNPKNSNDRTWCFWERGAGEWDWAVSKVWNKGGFQNNEGFVECFTDEFQYKMIESKMFYEKIKTELSTFPEIEWKNEKVLSFTEIADGVEVFTEQAVYNGKVLFNSILEFDSFKKHEKYPLLLQHFKGWFIQTEATVFEDNRALFMDFSVPQKGNTRFMYVLPTSPTEALVEYTLFSPTVLSPIEYEKEIRDYLGRLGIEDYQIVREENGSIPMTTFPLWKNNSKKILNIGTAGGWTKASTGYTFKNSAKLSKKLIPFLKKEGVDFTHFYKTNRFLFYDSLFVSVLYSDNTLGYTIFSRMFSKVQPELVFSFLDEKTTVTEELKVIWSCPKLPFLNALKQYVLHRLF